MWNASTNSPTLADGTGTAGWFYEVNVAGTQNLGSGNQTFNVGDWVVYDGSVWDKSTNSNEVVSVNGLTGAVSLTTTNIPEGTNLYFTNGRFTTQFNTKTSDDLTEGITNLYFTNARAKTATVSDAIVDGVTDVAPSQNAVFDALALKADASAVANKADTNLNNLVTTSINQDLLPSSTLTRVLGSVSLLWSNLFADKISSANGAQIDVSNRALQFNGSNVVSWFNNGLQFATSKLLRLTTDDGLSTIGVKPPASGASLDYTVPSAIPTANGAYLTATTAGVLSWKNDSINVEARRATTNQTIGTSATKIQFNAKSAGSSTAFDEVTNFRFTVPAGFAGVYKFDGCLLYSAAGALLTTVVFLYKNGNPIRQAHDAAPNGAQFGICYSFQCDAVATDYFEVFASNSTSATLFSDGAVFGGSTLNISKIS
jgi:hypothetical protein